LFQELIDYLSTWLVCKRKNYIESVVAVIFQSAFHSEMYQNNIFLFFLKKIIFFYFFLKSLLKRKNK